jgi:diguanylate cyclase (GGDEF)-like protein
MTRAALYAIGGAALSLAEPIGLLIVRETFGSRPIPAELSLERVTYIYVFGTTAIILGFLGYLIGRQADRLEWLAGTDALTALPNRRALRRRLADDLKRARRYRFPVSLVLIDLDGLKAINDARGHAAGDGAIRRVAEAISLTLREPDFGARWGGDEFAVVMPNTNAAAAYRSAERLRMHVANSSHDADDRIAISVGIATFDPTLNATAGASVEQLSKSADAALYEAKRAGRNRVHAA